MNDIKIKKLSKRFGDKVVLDGLDLTLKHGEISCIMGESGCGKSTLIKLILGLYTPDAGEIEGVPARLSAVFQEDRLCEDFSALTNVRLAAARGVTADQIKADFAALGLDGNEKTPARALSGGMRRRVALIRALRADAELIILDEPFAGLDEATHAAAAEYIKSRRKERTVIVVTHDAADAALLGAVTVYRM
ncbi:MAG: ATP-binding cassette domain-containing protein [Clostridia bacterium]|nr:ATP-binding cassette domain-containing protein [Clostridia bacterium]